MSRKDSFSYIYLDRKLPSLFSWYVLRFTGRIFWIKERHRPFYLEPYWLFKFKNRFKKFQEIRVWNEDKK